MFSCGLSYSCFIQANAEFEVKIRELHDESQKWKFEVEAGKKFTTQLVEKVKVLEKYEEEVKKFSTMSKDYEKMESKVEVLKGKYFFSLPLPPNSACYIVKH